jgi:hypothetical protein
VKTGSRADGTGTMAVAAGVEDFGAEVEAEVVAVAVAEVAARLTIGTGGTISAGIVIVGAMKMISEVGVVVAGVATETDLIPAVLALLQVLVRIASH